MGGDLKSTVVEGEIPVDTRPCYRLSSRQCLALPIWPDHLLSHAENPCGFDIGNLVLDDVGVDATTNVLRELGIRVRAPRHTGQL